jgi:hypothetical protein
MLTAKAHAINLLGAQAVPELALSIAHGLPQSSRALVGHAQGYRRSGR